MTDTKDDAARTRKALAIIAIISLGIVVWNLVAYFTIGDRQRQWQYAGNAPLIPAESYSSTEPAQPPVLRPGGVQAPKQVDLPQSSTVGQATPGLRSLGEAGSPGQAGQPGPFGVAQDERLSYRRPPKKETR